MRLSKFIDRLMGIRRQLDVMDVPDDEKDPLIVVKSNLNGPGWFESADAELIYTVTKNDDKGPFEIAHPEDGKETILIG